MTTVASAGLDALRARGQTLAVAESLTAGLVCSTLGAIPGASDVLRGGVVAYATDVKSSVLGVDDAVISRHGVVSRECAEAMAERARALFAADWAVGTTGVAGPTGQEGHSVGTVFVAVSGPGVLESVELQLAGDRDSIRSEAVARSLALLVSACSRSPQT